jgi:predicted nucleic acid-binding protein
MAAVLLDTTVLIDVLRGRDAAVDQLRRLQRRGDTAYLCAVNAEELARGLRPSEADVAARLVAGLRAAPLGPAEGWRAGEWRRDFARRGRTLSQADCLIAAAAGAIDARVATGNPKDFPMRDVQIEHWPAGA